MPAKGSFHSPAYAVDCPTCDSKVGVPCTTARKKFRDQGEPAHGAHADRLRIAREDSKKKATTMTVRDCFDCPLLAWVRARQTCGVDGGPDQLGAHEDPGSGRPENCPLNRGPVTIVAAE